VPQLISLAICQTIEAIWGPVPIDGGEIAAIDYPNSIRPLLRMKNGNQFHITPRSAAILAVLVPAVSPNME
jgi:hypothetical protein